MIRITAEIFFSCFLLDTNSLISDITIALVLVYKLVNFRRRLVLNNRFKLEQ